MIDTLSILDQYIKKITHQKWKEERKNEKIKREKLFTDLVSRFEDWQKKQSNYKIIKREKYKKRKNNKFDFYFYSLFSETFFWNFVKFQL